MATKIIKLNNGTDTYAPVTLASAVQFNTGGDTPISVQDAFVKVVQMIWGVADDIATMTPATESAAGKKGFVPDPPAGSQNKVLTGAATFKAISAFQDAHATGLLYKTMNTTEEFTLFDDTKFTGSPVSLATIASPAINVSLLIKDPVFYGKFYGELVDPSQAVPTISLDGTTNTPTLDTATNMFYLDTWSYAAPTNILFNNKSNIKSIKKLKGLDTSNVTDMQYMFNECSSLTSLDLSSFNTSKVTRMNFMFYGCSSLKDVYITVESTLNKLTNNLTSQRYNYIPSNGGKCTIHYNNVDYKWQNNAWTPQS